MRNLAVVVILLSAVTASGGIEHTILHNVTVGRVRTWVGPDAIPGLSSERLATIVEGRLKESGVPVSTDGEATLILSVEAYGGAPGMCFVTVEGNLMEPATLDRNGIAVAASSWHRGGTVITKSVECAESTTTTVNHVLADFVEAYRAMNPEAHGD